LPPATPLQATVPEAALLALMPFQSMFQLTMHLAAHGRAQ